MRRFAYATVTAAALCALAAGPAMAQSSGSTPPSGTEPGSGTGAAGTGATDQAGSQPGSDGVTGTGPRDTAHQEGSTAGTTGRSQAKGDHAGMSKGSATDRAFIEKAAAGGLAEVELGKLASGQAQNGDVKHFGQMMVTDHTKANAQLTQIADAAQAKAPTTLRPKDQAFYDRLAKLTGDEFDRTYMQHMVEDHEHDVAEFKKASTSLSDSALKQFATDTLPTLQKHLQEARTVYGKVSGGAKGTSGTSKSGHDTSGTAGRHDVGAGAGHGSTSPTGTTPPRPPQ